jgi:hypothetical protein
MGKRRSSYRILVRKLDVRTPLGRLRRILENNIKLDIQG